MKKLVLTLILIAFHSLPALAQKALFPGLSADASAREFNGKYYLYCTHDLPGAGKGWKTEDFHVYSSDDLVTWKDEGVIFSKKDVTWANGSLWAPDCIERNGKYYLYYGDKERDINIGVAVSDSPTGPFKDPLGHPLVKKSDLKDGRAMDPCIFIDDDGQAYLYIGGSNHFNVLKLKSDMITWDGDVVPLQVENAGEGPWVHKKDGLYYLSYPVGNFKGPSKNQEMVYSTATNPLGPWQYRGVILRDNGGGNVHGSIAKFGSQWYLFYHIPSPTTFERKVCAEYLDYNPDGTIKPITMTKEGVVLKP